MCKTFYYKSYDFDAATGTLRLCYETDTGFAFAERLTFPPPVRVTPGLERIFFLLHIACGISYYKAFLPSAIAILSGALSRAEAAFFDDFYLKGLGEFAVKNKVNLQGKIRFPFGAAAEKPDAAPFKKRALVPIGGGKDSCLTLEIVKELGIEATAISVGSARPIEECIKVAGLTSRTITRVLDPQLMELNATGKVYNGHVPITALLAFVLWAAAALYDYKWVVMSCEQSANAGNTRQGDLAINHQWGKSFEFEQAFHQLTQAVTPDFAYFSLLRPLTEAHIARLFSQKCTRYFPAFISCNKAFKLDKSKRLSRWCGACDKCRFVFLILAPFMDKDTLIQILGNNPLNDAAQIGGYAELLGLSGHKPFECVGEIDECRWAFHQLKSHPQWRGDAVVAALNPPSASAPFQLSAEHLIPQEFSHALEIFKQ